MNPNILVDALTAFLPQVLPEAILAGFACVLFLGATCCFRRSVCGPLSLLGLALAGLALAWVVQNQPTLERIQASLADAENAAEARTTVLAQVYAAPVLFTRLALFFKVLALVSGVLLVLLGWDEAGDEHTGEYHGCLLLIVAGIGLTGAANDLITLFLALELVSIPTYVLLYLARSDSRGQEATIKYFLLSVFSSGLMLFGLSYLYGLAGTTNIPAILDALAGGRTAAGLEEGVGRLPWAGVLLVAIVLVVAGLGFRITAVPFHFYAPDVYEGTTTPSAALLALVPKIVGFAALLRLLGYVPVLAASNPLAMGEQVPMLLWIMAAVTMTLGNILALLQDNLKRMLAYSSVAHAGYMLIGLAVVPYLASGAPGEAVGGAEALLFYLIAYGAMTVGAFAVLHHLSSGGRTVETVDDLAGLSRSHPGVALVMVLFLFSLIGIPLTAGFAGKFLLFWDAMGLSSATTEQAWLYRVLALIGAVNAAIGAWYYLRMATAMYLREAIEPLPPTRLRPVLGTVAACALLTLALGVYPNLVLAPIRQAVSPRPAEAAAGAGPARELAGR